MAINITKAMRALAVLQDATRKQIEATQINFLLRLYQIGDEGAGMNEIAPDLGISPAAVGRNAKLFGHGDSKKADGYNLVHVFYDPMKPRANCVRLTDEGKALVEKYLAALEKAIS